MRFLRDQRGQSVVIGTVILFGFLIIALSLYQAQIVPAENTEVEFDHSQEVVEEFLTLRNSIGDIATTGGTRSTAIGLGTRYPQRTFAINPPPATGKVETTRARAIEINATVASTAHPNIQAFWTDVAPTFDTQSIQYTSRYNELRSAGRLTYEHSYVTTGVEDAVVLRSEQTLVGDNRISVPLLTGNVSETGVQPSTIDAKSRSPQQRTIPITGDGSAIEIRLPTAVDNATALANRLTIPAAETVTADGDAIVITVPETETYRLGVGAVSVGDEPDPEPAYVVPVGGENVLVNQSVGVEVRDKYNNPVAGATVTIDGRTLTTNDAGQVFTTANESGELVAQLNPTPASYEEVVFEVRAAGSTGTDSVVGPNIAVAPGDQDVTVQADATIGLGDSSNGTVTLAGGVDSVGTVDRVRSGTPIQAIQYDVVGPDGTEFITGARYAQFDTDLSERQFSFDGATGITDETLIDTSDWPTGTNTLRLTAQDASGRVTPNAEQAVVNVTVEDGGVMAPQYPDRGSDTTGTLSNFENMQADDGNTAILDGEGGGGNPFEVTTVTENVPAGDYTLEINVTAADTVSNGNPVTVTVSNANGDSTTVDITETGLTEINFDHSTAGNITVEYAGSNKNSRIEINYQRLVIR